MENKKTMGTEYAIDSVTKALAAGAAEPIVLYALMSEGFTKEKSITIMRWAYLKLKSEVKK
jgi:hypothetical protein